MDYSFGIWDHDYYIVYQLGWNKEVCCNGNGVTYELGIHAVASGGDGPKSYAFCRTAPDNWLEVECSSNGELAGSWNRPSGRTPNMLAPSGYAATVVNQDGQAFALYDGPGDHPNRTEASTTVALGGTYTATLVSKNASGGPVYSQTKSARCRPGPISGASR